jgi:uncharacterized cupredoxin-like copper-binding protein
MKEWLGVGVLAVLGLAGSGCGSDDPSTEGSAVEVMMRDIAFSPETITVEAGEPVTFKFVNVGKVDHEAIIGDEPVQDQHEQEMQKDDGEMDDHSQSSDGMNHGAEMKTNALTLKPGESGELTREFAAGDDGILIGCHEPDHYEAGMKITVEVES